MKTQTKTRLLKLVFLAAAMVFAAGATTPAFGQDCEPKDEQVVDAIKAKLGKSKSLASQMSHINVSVVRDPATGSVQAWKVTGWVQTRKDYDYVINAMHETYYDLGGDKCVGNVKINENDFRLGSEFPESLKSVGGCGPGTVACGDICIPQGESCNINTR